VPGNDDALAKALKDLESREAARSTWMVVAVVIAGMALVASLVAWGYASSADSKKGTTGGAATAAASVPVSLSEFKIDPNMVNASVGDQLVVTNKGSVAHNLTIEGTSLASPLIDPGKSATLDTSSLKAGDYTISCNVAGHKAAGMSGMLMLAASGGASSGGASSGGASSAGASANPAAVPGLTAEMVAAGMVMTPDQMKKNMHDTTVAFPAKTAGTGGQLLAPTVLPDGTRQFELTAQVVDWEKAPGQTVKAWTYNGTVPGPTIRVNPGDKVSILLHNHLPEATTIHFHGIRGPQAVDGTPYISQDPVEPGKDFTYSWTVGNEPEIGMYHSHFDSTRQVNDGMAGAFIVGDVPLPQDATTAGAPASLPNQVMFLNDSGNIGLTLNGKSFPATAPIVAQQNQWIEVTYFNEGQMIHPMHLHEIPQMIVARDGFPLAHAEMDDTVMVAPGQRITVLVHATDVGTWVWHCHILSHAENDQGMFGMVTALIVK